MLDIDRLLSLARGEIPGEPDESGVTGVAPVASQARVTAHPSLSHWNYSATGATGKIRSSPIAGRIDPVTDPVAAFSISKRWSDLSLEQTEREAIAIELGHVPEVYVREFAHIQALPPAHVPRQRWDMFVNDAGLFLDAWGKEAARLGWTADDLFGLDPVGPMVRYDRMGLLWMLQGNDVVELTATMARLRGGLGYQRRPSSMNTSNELHDDATDLTPKPGFPLGHLDLSTTERCQSCSAEFSKTSFRKKHSIR